MTSSDVKLKAASERYQNAVKGITNILTIIDQARANKYKAQTDLTTYNQAYNVAIKEQKNAQNTIITAELKIKQIETSIGRVTEKINGLTIKITEISKSINVQKASKESLIQQIQISESKRVDVLNKLNEIDSKLAQLI